MKKGENELPISEHKLCGRVKDPEHQGITEVGASTEMKSKNPESELWREQDRMDHLNLVLRSIQTVNQVIVGETDREKLIKGACQNLVKNRGYAYAWIVLFGENSEPSLMADAGIDEAPFSALMEQINSGKMPHCLCIATAKQGVASVKDVFSECGECPLVRIFENRKAMTTKLEHAGKSYGFLTVSIPFQTISDEVEQILFQTVSTALASALGFIEADELLKKAEKLLNAENKQELSLRNRIAESFLMYPDEEMYRNILALLLDVMESKYGVFGYLDEKGDLVVPRMTGMVLDKFQIIDEISVFPHEQWGDCSWPAAIAQKQTIVMNEPSTDTPKGRIPITRHISMPLIHKDVVIGLIQVANKDSAYTEKEVELLEMMGRTISPVLETRLKKERQDAELLGYKGHLEDLVKVRTSELQATNKELQQFAYVASHDLQEPLRMIASFLQLLSRRYSGKLDKDADEFIKYAVDGATRLQTMINDLLLFSRVGTRGKEFTDVDMKVVIEDVLANLAVAIDNGKANISVGDMPTIKADQSQMIQLTQNLVENAIKFRGKDTPRIEISANRGKGEWIFSVRDNGIGIESKYFERIFIVFQRLHAGDVYKGTGIGLSLAKKVVERHGGRIWLESEVGKGSIFYFTIPDVRNELDEGGGN
jgi:signal transduction histidine kinase